MHESEHMIEQQCVLVCLCNNSSYSGIALPGVRAFYNPLSFSALYYRRL